MYPPAGMGWRARLGTVVAERYKIESILGKGGMGVVFGASHVFTKRPIALKLLDPSLAHDDETVHRFLREARAAARIQHPAVVDVLDMGRDDDGTVYLALERLDGEPLSSRLKREPRLSAEDTVKRLVPLDSSDDALTAPPPSCASIRLSVEVSGMGAVQETTSATTLGVCRGLCGAEVEPWRTVSLGAIPDNGWALEHWSGCHATGTSTDTCRIELIQPQRVRATFTRRTHPLVVEFFGAVRDRWVTIAAEGEPAHTCTNDCDLAVPTGVAVDLTAGSRPGAATFEGWGGDCAGAASTCRFEMTAGKNVSARFSEL